MKPIIMQSVMSVLIVSALAFAATPASAQWSASVSVHVECFWHINHWAAHEEASASTDGPSTVGNSYTASVSGTHIADSDSGTSPVSAYDVWVGDVATGTVVSVSASATASFLGVPQAADADSGSDTCA